MKDILERDYPSALKSMTNEELDLLAVRIREFLIDKVSKTGGHIASNLGIVELTIALHKVFDTPKDKIIWDVGHQAYVHKILTGRKDGFDELRNYGGISGFPKRAESEFDVFDTGHASTSISAACGMAAARDLRGDDNEVIAVIGDGSLTGGLAYEGINNIGSKKSKVIIILNDNGMSISKNIGGVSNHLAKLRTSRGYRTAKLNVKNALSRVPVAGKAVTSVVSGTKELLKYAMIPKGVVLEELGFTYIGPVDGHDIPKLEEALEAAKQADNSVVVHVITKKGKGYRNAEKDPDKFHGISPFDPTTGKVKDKKGKTFSDVFGEEMVSIGKDDDRLVAITAAMSTPTGLSEFFREFPERAFDVGIAEEHAVTFAASLALEGLKPVCAIYSSFLQRAYDQIVEDVALQDLPVIFAIDRAGIVGQDGETHHGLLDISFLSTVPGMTIFAPSSGGELRAALRYALTMDSPCAIRYPRGSCISDEEASFDGTNKRISDGKDVDIFAVGTMLNKALEVRSELSGMGIDAGIVQVVRPYPVDDGLIVPGRPVFTLEDGMISGGFGERLSNLAKDNDVTVLGFPDTFIEHGKTDELFEKYGLDKRAVTERIKAYLEGKN